MMTLQTAHIIMYNTVYEYLKGNNLKIKTKMSISESKFPSSK